MDRSIWPRIAGDGGFTGTGSFSTRTNSWQRLQPFKCSWASGGSGVAKDFSTRAFATSLQFIEPSLQSARAAVLEKLTQLFISPMRLLLHCAYGGRSGTR